ncbi:MAG: hypothetical protein PHN69_01530 [Candidatus Pacebacteria bacterium]|nr:hypothetical protein [Candidatus Paceibacterota bacterium]
MNQEAVESEIHDYMAMNGTNTVPCHKLAQFGQRHGVYNARFLNDLVKKVWTSHIENAA